MFKICVVPLNVLFHTVGNQMCFSSRFKIWRPLIGRIKYPVCFRSSPGINNDMWKLCRASSRSLSQSKCLRFSNPHRGPREEVADCHDTKVVELSVGSVRGRRQHGLYCDAFYSFEGIPFAKPPLGDLRFVASCPVDPWRNQELDARQEKPVPLQVDRQTGKVFGSEDCLYLNVYTKHVSD